MKSHFDARVVPSVAYTDPEIAWVGLTEDEAKKNGTRSAWRSFRGRVRPRDRQRPRRGLHQADLRRREPSRVGGGIVGTGAAT
jgi:dihydrolipoamide dehydrogenase